MNRDLVIDALQELGSREAQETLWLSDGSNGSLVSSFVEAIERLCTDSGLAGDIESGAAGLDDRFVALYKRLKGVIRKIDYWNRDPRAVIDDERMGDVRAISRTMLDLILPDRDL
ncbi:hypothetical protein [Paludisphaera sp.]|uniref:hypothetical protein n=1 Tax=Paludisphaera sp. TaxID=2017432 RepID=UPI00301DFFB7